MAAKKKSPSKQSPARWSPSRSSTLGEVLDRDNDEILAIISMMAVRTLARTRGERPSPHTQAGLLIKSVCEAVYAIDSADIDDAGEYSKRLGAALMVLHGAEKHVADEKGGTTRSIYTGLLVGIVNAIIQHHVAREDTSPAECVRSIAMFTGRAPEIELVAEAMRTPRGNKRPPKGLRSYFEALAEVMRTMGIDLVHDAFGQSVPLKKKDVDAIKEARDEARKAAQTMVAEVEKSRPTLLVHVRMALGGTPDPAINMPLELEEYLLGTKFWPTSK